MILYITRKFPPSVGGMQRFNQKLVAHLSALAPLHVIAWGGSQKWLLVFLSIAFVRTLWYCLTRPIQLIYISDGLLSPLGCVLKLITRKPVCVTIHGRDIAFANPVYQWLVPLCLRHLNKVICVSHALEIECQKRLVPKGKLIVIPNGISPMNLPDTTKAQARQNIEPLLKQKLADRKILLTVGRLVPKKGIDLFLSHILPRIRTEYPKVLYIIAGDGPLHTKIRSIIDQAGLNANTAIIGSIGMNDPLLTNLYQAADLFVMPNVAVQGDFEGFGIVALEAGICGLPVVASRTDGIPEAVHDQKNGFLIPPGDREEWTQTILRLLRDDRFRLECGQRTRDYVRDTFAWEAIAGQYHSLFKTLIG